MSSSAAEKFCLRWNDFESNISTAFRELREDKDFFDVTLACDDNQMQAHKVILSACSPFFRTVLRKNPHDHPLLYLKGVSYENLAAVLNFMYHGEVNVAQEQLNSFLAVAEDLQVKGLTQNESSRDDRPKPAPAPPPNIPPPPPQRSQKRYAESSHNQSNATSKLYMESNQTQSNHSSKFSRMRNDEEPETRIKTEAPVDIVEVDEEMPLPAEGAVEEYHEENQSWYEEQSSYEEQGQNVVDNSGTGAELDFDDYVNQNSTKLDMGQEKRVQCLLCDKITAHVGNMKQHFEVYHFHRQYKCDTCQKNFKTKNSLDVHKKNQHNTFSGPRYPF